MLHLFEDPTDGFRFSQLFIADSDSTVELLHRVDVGSATNVSEVHAVSIFRTQISTDTSRIFLFNLTQINKHSKS